MKTLDYCRQFALHELKKVPREDTKYHIFSAGLPMLLQRSEKFLINKDAMFLENPDKRYAALDETKRLRLPFPETVVEFEKGWLDQAIGDKTIDKNILYAWEYPSGESIGICVILGMSDGSWVILPCAILKTIGYLTRQDNDVLTQFFLDESFFPRAISEAQKQDVANAIQPRLHALMQLLNMLSCSNVDKNKLPVSPTKKALGSGKKIPYDEYWVLTVENKDGSHSKGTGGTGRHPREYVKRGHIRRLPSGACTWVNAHVCSKGNGGKIIKDYAIK